MKHLKLTFYTDNEDEPQAMVCAISPDGEKTICGHETSPDRISELLSVEKTSEAIDCRLCAAMIRHCHKFALHEIASYEHR